jgi:catechol 2,3-dioxygenase-like lactoylglutathione lyase family enzyme
MLSFDHVHLRSPDDAAAAEWYVRVLGASITRRVGPPRPRTELTLGGLTILITRILPGEAVNPAAPQPSAGLEHIGFIAADIDAAAAAYAARGAEFSLPPTTLRGRRIAFLRAPDGVSVELLEPPPDEADAPG